MSKRRGGVGSKYSDSFKRQLVAESHCAGSSVLKVSRRHGVPTNRIYAWRNDARFQPDGSEVATLLPVEVVDRDTDSALGLPEPQPIPILPSPAQIEITLENGRKLSVSDGVDARFVLELARGLAA